MMSLITDLICHIVKDYVKGISLLRMQLHSFMLLTDYTIILLKGILLLYTCIHFILLYNYYSLRTPLVTSCVS